MGYWHLAGVAPLIVELSDPELRLASVIGWRVRSPRWVRQYLPRLVGLGLGLGLGLVAVVEPPRQGRAGRYLLNFAMGPQGDIARCV